MTARRKQTGGTVSGGNAIVAVREPMLLHMPVRGGGDVPVYDIGRARVCSANGWAPHLRGRLLVVMDRAVADLAPTKALMRTFHKVGGAPPAILCISVGEDRKTMREVECVLGFLMENTPNERATIICVGGGVLINIAGFAASIFLRGKVSTIYVPTTLTALADAAIGNKSGINWSGADGTMRKHAVGSYFEPTAVLVDSAFLKRDDPLDHVDGCAELTKHGILQNASLLRDVSSVLADDIPSVSSLFDLAIRTATLKQAVVEVDYHEVGIGRILQYGHLHAHSLERATSFGISHNHAVWCGLYIDLLIGGDPAVHSIRQTLAFLRQQLSRLAHRLTLPPLERLRAAYHTETKLEPVVGHDHYSLVAVSRIGVYRRIDMTALATVEVGWSQVATAWRDIGMLVPTAISPT